MNPLQRPSAGARRDSSLGEIGGSSPSEVDPGLGSSGDSGFRAEAAAGGSASLVAGGSAPQAANASAPLAADAAWPSGAAPPAALLALLFAPGSGAGALAGGAAMGAAGNMADWWSQTSGHLGQEWLASVLAAVTTPASTSTMDQTAAGEAEVAEMIAAREEGIPVRGGCARRHGGGGRGGRAPRPPAPAPAAPSSINLEPTDAIEVDWCDENTRIVCELFATKCKKEIVQPLI